MNNRIMKTIIASILCTIIAGCSMPTKVGMNWVEPRRVQMEKNNPSYRQDLLHCREIAEQRDYFTPYTNRALGQAIAAGIAGGIVGGLAGGYTGDAGLGAAIGGATTVSYTAIRTDPGQPETATTVWARCMAAHGHSVYGIDYHW